MKEGQDLVKAWQKRMASLETEKGRYGSPIDPSTQHPGPSEFVTEERREEEEDDEELTGRFDEESKALLRDLYLKAAQEYGFMPSLKDFRSYLERKGVPSDATDEKILSEALSEVWQPHGGSDNAVNLRTPGQPPGKIPAKPGNSGSSTGRAGSGQRTMGGNYQSMRAGGYVNPTAPSSKLSTGRSRGLSDADASAQIYGGGHQDPLSGGKTRAGQAYNTYDKPTRHKSMGGFSPLTKAFITISDTYAQKGGLPSEEDMQAAQQNAFQTMLEEDSNIAMREEDDDQEPIRYDEGKQEEEWSDEEGQRISSLLRREADESEALAEKYETYLRRSIGSGIKRNLADEESIKRSITDMRQTAMIKRKRVYSLQKSDALRLPY